MRLAEPWALLALVLVPAALFAWWLKERQNLRQLKRAGDPHLVRRLTEAGPDGGAAVRLAQAILLSLAMALVAVALARPQFGLRTELRKARGMDVVLALDLSRSMLARDVVPSRLERARIELSDLIDNLGGDRVGLVGFTSIALPLAPLTVDHAAVKLQLRSATPDDLPRGGTSISDAVQAGLRMLESAPESGGAQAIVVVTDGEEHEGDPKAAANKAAELGVEVHVVGVGSRTGEPIPMLDKGGNVTGYLKDARGQTVVSRLNEAMLRDIAEAGTGLVALPGPQGGLDLSAVRAHLSTQKKAELSDRVVRVYEERFQWFLAPALFLLLLATGLRPRRRLAQVLTLALVMTAGAGPASADPLKAEDPDAKTARQALADGRGEDAVKAYEQALDRLGPRADLLYDLGLAETSRGELDKAISRFQQAKEASDSARLRGKSAFALGNTYRQLNKYDEAMKAYRQALMEDPSLTGARRNLELTRAMKAVAAAQPKPDNPDGEPDPDKPPPEDQDGGVSDAGDSSDGGDGSDAGPQDAGQGDGGGEQGDGGDSPDAGAGSGQGEDSGAQQDGSQGTPDGGSGQSPDANTPAGQDGGSGDASPAAQPDQAQAEPEKALDKQDVEELLDALQEQEKALERKRMLQKLGGKTVKKDW